MIENLHVAAFQVHRHGAVGDREAVEVPFGPTGLEADKLGHDKLELVSGDGPQGHQQFPVAKAQFQAEKNRVVIPLLLPGNVLAGRVVLEDGRPVNGGDALLHLLG